MMPFIHPMFGYSAEASPPDFAPETLFASGEQGFWYDVQDLSTMWQDAAGTIPAEVGYIVGRLDDKSGNGNHATQATAGLCPILRQNGTTGKYYLEFDGSDDNLVTSVPFGSATELSVFAGLRNRVQTDLAGYLEMVSSGSPGPAVMRMRQQSAGATTIWDGLLYAGGLSEGTDARAQASTITPNTMVISSQHDIANDLSTIRINGLDGTDGTGEKGGNTLGTMDVNIGKLNFRTSIAADLYFLLVSSTLVAEPEGAEYYIDGLMGGGVMPAYRPPGPPPVYPDEGFARDLGGRMPWAAFGQPISTTEHADNFGFWQDVGVNVMGGWNPSVSGLTYDPTDLNDWNSTSEAAAEAWDAAAIAKGFKLDRFPFTPARALADLEAGMREHIVGWSVQDEAEAGTGFDIAPQLALMDEADPTYQIVRSINSTGPAIIYQQGALLFPYFNQFAGYPAVQAMFDFYPVQQTTLGKTVILGYRPNGQPYTATHNSQGLVSARTEEWTILGVPTTNYLSHSPYMLFMATGGFVEGYQTTLRIPTPEQVRFQIADAIVMGAEGIAFFPQRFEWLESPVGSGNYYKTFTQFNGTPSDVKTQLTTTIANWQALETEFATNLLIDPATNRMWPATYRVCPDTSPSGQQTTAESGWTFVSPPSTEYLPGPFQGSVRAVTGVGNVYFIQNLGNASASLTDATWGFSAVPFAAWETLVFIEGDLVNPVWSDIDGILP